MLEVALSEAKQGLAEGGIPVGAAIFDPSGRLIGKGHNRRVQNDDPSIHGETDAFRNAGRQRSYRDLIMVTTLAPCWYCSGLVRQFGFGTLVVGDSKNFQGGVEWLRSLGVNVVDLDSPECVSMMAEYIRKNPADLARRYRRSVRPHENSAHNSIPSRNFSSAKLRLLHLSRTGFSLSGLLGG